MCSYWKQACVKDINNSKITSNEHRRGSREIFYVLLNRHTEYKEEQETANNAKSGTPLWSLILLEYICLNFISFSKVCFSFIISLFMTVQ